MEMSDERVNTGSAELRGSITPFSGMLFYRGALAITGTLEVSGERLHFEPKGWLDLLVGVGQKWEMALSAVDRVEVRGLLDTRFGPQVEVDTINSLRRLDEGVTGSPYSGRETRR